MISRSITLLILMAVSFCGCLTIGPPRFGMNKIRQDGAAWRVVKTERILVFFSDDTHTAAARVLEAVDADYDRITSALWIKSEEPYRIFLYSSPTTYSGTNITEGLVDGSAGFTEFYKNRVALYVTGNANRLRRVALHEFTHAVMLSELLKSPYRSLRLLITAAILPDWYIEGVAEYYSDDFDTLSDMMVRDAVMNGGLLGIDELRGFSALPSHQVGLAYKTACTFIAFLIERFGPTVQAEILREFKYEPDWSAALSDTTGISGKLLADEWRRLVTKRYQEQSGGRKAEVAVIELKEPWADALFPIENQGRLYFISDAEIGDGFYDIYSSEDSRVQRITRQADVLPGGLDVTDDGATIAVITEKNRDPRLTLIRQDGKRELFRIQELDYLSSPRFLTETQVILCGLRDGNDDLYLYDVTKETLTQLTNTPESESEPWVSDDREWIVFSREYGEQKDLAALNLRTLEDRRLTDTPWDERSPALNTLGDLLYYSSDRPDERGTKIFDIYVRRFEDCKDEMGITHCITGCLWPCPSRGRLIFSQYRGGSYQLASRNMELPS